jgi:hypothetical protein
MSDVSLKKAYIFYTESIFRLKHLANKDHDTLKEIAHLEAQILNLVEEIQGQINSFRDADQEAFMSSLSDIHGILHGSHDKTNREMAKKHRAAMANLLEGLAGNFES